MDQLEELKSQIGNQEISKEKETSLLDVFSNLNSLKDGPLYQVSAIFDQLDRIDFDSLSPMVTDLVNGLLDCYLDPTLKLKTEKRNHIIQKILKKFFLLIPSNKN